MRTSTVFPDPRRAPAERGLSALRKALAPTHASAASRGLLCVLILSVGCEARYGAGAGSRYDLRNDPRSTRPGPRQIVEMEWESVLKVGGSESDTTLYYPTLPQADSAGAYVYDVAEYRVVRLSKTGTVEWTYGRKGQGPDEFRNVRDLELDSSGRLWVLDPQNARITVLDGRGHVQARIPLRDLPYSEQVVPLSSGEAILVAAETEQPLLHVDAAGNVRAAPEFPWPALRNLHPLASQLTAATDPWSEYSAVAFRAGNGFFVLRAGVPLPYYGIFVEHTEFPAVEEAVSGNTRTSRLSRPVFSAWSIALRDGRLFVLFSGRTEHRNAVLDMYEAETGDYVRSVILPRRLSAISVAGGLLYGTYEDPYPGLEAWRPADPSILEDDGRP